MSDTGAFPYACIAPAQTWSYCSQKDWPIWPGEGLSTAPFITPTTRLVSAGSCFALVLAQYLQQQGYHYLITEPGPPWLSPEQARQFHYGQFSARYGFIYSARQFWQLLQRAWGILEPVDDCWQAADGSWVDALRPDIQPGGFNSPEEMRTDRQAHLHCVRTALTQAEVLILTLGLTEAWLSGLDGTVYPICPGRRYGQFDPARYVFHNFTVDEVVADLSASVDFLAQVNPSLRWILTLSPIPLAATMEPRHVLEATGYSKAVLRVAIETIRHTYTQVSYFPAWEWVHYDPARALTPERRRVRAETVSTLMHYFERGFVCERPQAPEARISVEPEDFEVCDGEALLELLNQDFERRQECIDQTPPP